MLAAGKFPKQRVFLIIGEVFSEIVPEFLQKRMGGIYPKHSNRGGQIHMVNAKPLQLRGILVKQALGTVPAQKILKSVDDLVIPGKIGVSGDGALTLDIVIPGVGQNNNGVGQGESFGVVRISSYHTREGNRMPEDRNRLRRTTRVQALGSASSSSGCSRRVSG